MLEKLPNEVGEALKTARPGLGALSFNDDALEDVDVEILLTSPAFAAGGAIPRSTPPTARESHRRWSGPGCPTVSRPSCC